MPFAIMKATMHVSNMAMVFMVTLSDVAKSFPAMPPALADCKIQ